MKERIGDEFRKNKHITNHQIVDKLRIKAGIAFSEYRAHARQHVHMYNLMRPEEKKKRLEEAEAKRQEMLESQKASKEAGGAAKKSGGGASNDARREMTKTKEQLEEEKKIALSIRIKPLELEAMDSDELKGKAEELFKIIVQLETDKYDYEQRRVTQDYELNELKERQKAQLRQKALKKGLDP